MFSARAFVGWYNGLPENREVSFGSPPPASSCPLLSQLLAPIAGGRGSHRPGGRSLAGARDRSQGSGKTEDPGAWGRPTVGPAWGANQTICVAPLQPHRGTGVRGSHRMEGLQLLTLPFWFFCFEKLLVVYLRETGRKNAL